MTHGRRDFLAIGAAALLLQAAWLGTASAQPAAPGRIHGTITALHGDQLAITTNAGDAVTIALPPKTPITGVAAATLADIKPGSFVGSAARPGADGKLVALEVHIFPESMRGAGEGHRPMDIAPQASMTNGTVGADIASVGSVSGRTITVQYADGAQTITVPANVPVVKFEVGSPAMLTPGAHVSIMVTGTAPALTAGRILVGVNGATPPL